MDDRLVALFKVLESCPYGHKKLDDPLFATDPPPAKYTIFDLDDEEKYNNETSPSKTPCPILNCTFQSTSLLDYENHYNTSHRYCCAECKKSIQSPHFLDIHIQETHDSFFAVASLKKPSYSCYVQECKIKSWTPEARLEHGVAAHRIPKNFRFEQTHLKPKSKPKKKNKKQKNEDAEKSMDVDLTQNTKEKKINFINSKQKTFYTGKKFTDDAKGKNSVNMDAIMTDLKDCLPST